MIANAAALLWAYENTEDLERKAAIANLVVPWEGGELIFEPGGMVLIQDTGNRYHVPSLLKQASTVPVVEGARSPAEWLVHMREEVLAKWGGSGTEAAISHEYDEVVAMASAPWGPLYAAFHLGRLFQEQKHAPTGIKLQKGVAR